MAATELGVLERLIAVHLGFDRAGLDHAVGGALALSVHVYPPRGTADVDINVTADPDRPDTVLSALPPQVEVHDSAAAEIRSTGQVRLWWRSPSLDTPVDLFLPQHPTYHQMVVERAEPADFLGTEIKVLTATDLMVFKMLFNRRRDWADIEGLIRCNAGDPDEAASWVAEFVGDDDPRLATLRQIRDEVAAES